MISFALRRVGNREFCSDVGRNGFGRIAAFKAGVIAERGDFLPYCVKRQFADAVIAVANLIFDLTAVFQSPAQEPVALLLCGFHRYRSINRQLRVIVVNRFLVQLILPVHKGHNRVAEYRDQQRVLRDRPYCRPVVLVRRVAVVQKTIQRWAVPAFKVVAGLTVQYQTRVDLLRCRSRQRRRGSVAIAPGLGIAPRLGVHGSAVEVQRYLDLVCLPHRIDRVRRIPARR